MSRALLVMVNDDIRAKAAREIRIVGDIAFVPLTRGYDAIIDATDVPLVSGRNWSALVCKRRNAVYAVRVTQKNNIKKMILMHRLLLDAPDHMQGDHIDGDGLNNRRSNLRLATHAQNQRNKGARKDSKSGIKGVCWDEKARHWQAEIMSQGKRRFLGYFDTPDEARDAYNAACSAEHQEFARLS